MLDFKNLGRVLVTGGTGFIGSSLVKKLIDNNVQVRVFDNNLRGNIDKLDGYTDKFDFIKGDITNYEEVYSASKDIDTVFHLAFVNGTNNFYNFPDKVLEVGVKGALTTMDAAMNTGVSKYVVTSSSEVYQQPNKIPTDENERIFIPDISNPRYSYSGAKIITELLTLHYLKKRSNITNIIVRPHNFIGPNMGVGHVIPQFILRMKNLSNNFKKKSILFPIQGTGNETRSFCYIEDAIDAILVASTKGKNGEIYHAGTTEEISIKDLALKIASILSLEIEISNQSLLSGSAQRRCPDISKLSKLGYEPRFRLDDYLITIVNWYKSNHLTYKEKDFLK